MSRIDRLGPGVALLAFGLRLLTAGHGVVTSDEPSWLSRSAGFYGALTHGSLRHLTVPIDGAPKTRPGVTTMWLGSLARGLTLALHKVGLVDGPTTPFERSGAGLRIAQVLVALCCSVLIGLIAVQAARLFGRRVGIVAGLLVAAEPFVVAHTVVLHTDGLLTLTLVAAALAVLVALRFGVADDPTGAVRPYWALGAGGLAGLALLTKVSALAFLPGLAVPAVVYAVRRRRAGLTALAEIARAAGLAAGALVATAVVLWPALWVDPVGQVRAVVQSARLGETGHATFFRGETTKVPGPTYYLLAMWLRTTPLVLFGAALGIVTTIVRRVRVVPVLVLAAIPVPFLLVISLSSKQFDRYALPVMVVLALLAAIAVDDLATGLAAATARWPEPRRRLAPRALAVVGIGAVISPILWVSPHPLAYFDPVAGGGERAQQTLLVGWGEGLEAVGRRITADRHGDCNGVVIAAPSTKAAIAFPCGVLIPLRARVYRNLSDVTYAVSYISDTQRGTREGYLALVRQQGTLVTTIRIQGIPYAELWRIDHPPPGACTDDRRAVPVAPRCA